MRFECPEVKRCCCCIPLRFGLLGWGCIKIVINLLSLTYGVNAVWKMHQHLSPVVGVGTLVFAYLFIFTLVSDIIFHSILILGAKQKDHRKIRIYYRYSIGAFVVNFVWSFSFIGYQITIWIQTAGSLELLMYFFLFSLHILLLILCVILLNLGVSLYMISLARSELIILKSNINFKFTNNFQNESIHVENEKKQDFRNSEQSAT